MTEPEIPSPEELDEQVAVKRTLRFLVIEIDEESGSLDIDGDPLASWEMRGIGSWLIDQAREAEDDAEPDAETS